MLGASHGSPGDSMSDMYHGGPTPPTSRLIRTRFWVGGWVSCFVLVEEASAATLEQAGFLRRPQAQRLHLYPSPQLCCFWVLVSSGLAFTPEGLRSQPSPASAQDRAEPEMALPLAIQLSKTTRSHWLRFFVASESPPRGDGLAALGGAAPSLDPLPGRELSASHFLRAHAAIDSPYPQRAKP
jgi:hypothetical protein